MYRIDLTPEQARVLSQALEVFARLGIGQFRDALRFLPLDRTQGSPPSGWSHTLDEIGQMLAPFMVHWVDGWSRSLGIASQDTDEGAKIAWDLYQVVRHRIAWDDAVADGTTHGDKRKWPEMMGVQYDEPLKCSGQPLAIIRRT